MKNFFFNYQGHSELQNPLVRENSHRLRGFAVGPLWGQIHRPQMSLLDPSLSTRSYRVTSGQRLCMQLIPDLLRH